MAVDEHDPLRRPVIGEPMAARSRDGVAPAALDLRLKIRRRGAPLTSCDRLLALADLLHRDRVGQDRERLLEG
jgi:hypothetical protein